MSVDGSWTELKGGDVLLKVLQDTKQGEDAQPIQKGDAVLLEFQAWYLEKDNVDAVEEVIAQPSYLFQKASSWLVIVGDPNSLPAGLDLGLQNLKRGQTAYIYCRNALPATRRFEKCSAPANATAVYHVSSPLQFVQDTSQLNPYFTIQKNLTRKKIANDLYQYEILILKAEQANEAANRSRALDLYRQVAREIKDLLAGTYFNSVEPNHPQRAECQQLCTDCYNNVVVIYMHGKDWTRALEAVDVALERTAGFPKTNVKALVRRAKICVMLATSAKKLERAREAMDTAENALGFHNKTEKAEMTKIQTLYEQRRQQLE